MSLNARLIETLIPAQDLVNSTPFVQQDVMVQQQKVIEHFSLTKNTPLIILPVNEQDFAHLLLTKNNVLAHSEQTSSLVIIDVPIKAILNILTKTLSSFYSFSALIVSLRAKMIDLIKQNYFICTELSDPLIAHYFNDLICFSYVSNAHIESQPHRELASGMSNAVGFEQASDKEDKVKQAIESSKQPHCFIQPSYQGKMEIVKSKGNSNCVLLVSNNNKALNRISYANNLSLDMFKRVSHLITNELGVLKGVKLSAFDFQLVNKWLSYNYNNNVRTQNEQRLYYTR